MHSLLKNKKSLPFIFLLLIVLSGIIFLVYKIFWKNEIKKELVYSVQIIPNDSSETKVNFNNVVSLKFPKGTIKKADTLDIYNVTGIEKPDDAEEHLKTYDIGFRKTDKLSDYFEMELSYENGTGNGTEDSKRFAVKQYDEKNKKWIDVLVETDKANKKLIITTNHFSLYSIFKYALNITPHPMMKLTNFKTQNEISGLPSIDAAMRMIEEYGKTGKPNEEAKKSGIQIFEEAFNLTSQGTTLGEEIFKLPICEKFNELTGDLGILFAVKQFAVETYEGKIDEARLNAYKNAMTFSIGKWGNRALKIANVGIFFLDIALTKFGEQGLKIRDDNYQFLYDNYNATWNQYRKTDEGWKSYVINLINTKDDFNGELDNYVNLYLNDALESIAGEIPDYLEKDIVNKEQYRLYKIFNSMKNDIEYEMKDKQKREISQKFMELVNLINSEFRISASVISNKFETGDLPVKIIVKDDQNLWEGETGEAGIWMMDCTNIGYIIYGGPKVSTLVHKNNTYTENIEFEQRSGKWEGFIKFHLNDAEENTSQVSTDFDAGLAGTYKGKIFINEAFPNNIASKEGPFEATVDKNGNVTMKASYTVITEFKSSDGYIRGTQKYELNGSGKFKKVGGKPGEYIAHVKTNVHVNSFSENKDWDLTTTDTKTYDNQSVMGLYLKGNRLYWEPGAFKIESSR